MPIGMSSQFGRARYQETIANRTIQSGGSLGGVKKAGIFGGSVSWPVGNMGSHVFYRAPQRNRGIVFALANTTRSPTQGTSYQVYRRGGGL